MSFQDLRNGNKPSSSSTSSASPSQAVSAEIFQINTAVASFRRLVDAIGTTKDTPQHRQKIHDTRQRILQLVKDTSAKLKSLSEPDCASDVDPNKKIEDAKLARDFQTTLQEFQKVQQLASERESNYSPSIPSSSLPPQASGSDESIEQEKQAFLIDQRRQEVVLLDNEISFREAMIEEKEEGIRDIVVQIGETNEIVKDLAVLVHEQGVVIEDIHSNIDNSATASTQGRVQLGRASKSVKAKCSWCWWLLGILVVVVVIFFLIIIL